MAASGLVRSDDAPSSLTAPAGSTPDELARDEAFWREVGRHYDRTRGILNLEHGYWSKMARPVRDTYLDALRMVDTQNSYYARKDYEADEAAATQRIARALGAHDDEIVITRNATEGFQSLVRQYRGLQAGDTVLLADVDYPGFKQHMHWLAEGRGVRVVEIELPPRADQATIQNLYVDAFDANPKTRLLLLTHVSNQHGLTVPVAGITAEARERGIDVVCDAAQSWGLLDYKVSDLGVDWAAFNLHKWIGAPLGTGALYIRRGTLARIAPFPGENDEQRIASRIHSGTVNFATRLAIPAALDFHEALGPANKEARLRYLRSLWTKAAGQMPHLELLGGADEASWSGIGSFRLAGKTTVDDAISLQSRMEHDFGIFTVIRKGLASGACVRVTPQVFSSPQELLRLVEALQRLA